MKNIPNILTGFRFLLVAAFVILFFYEKPLWALAAFLLAGVTDVLDGYLARRNGWVSNLGKIIDPLADKLMQFAALICFAIAGYLPFLLVLPFILKEVIQWIFCIFMFRTQKFIAVSHWYGKAAITVFYAAVALTLFFRWRGLTEMPYPALTLALWCLSLLLMLAVFVSYMICYSRISNQLKKNTMEKGEP
ncbi:MAG: CDP-alcohol phosphatidyltransferase family protein [Eubacteriales bacterium]|nr:CDP-alcohol phosphatidyltransferase family protein [Eubacteriales bacterium]MDY2827534.1 CDP-alcohol phosphatidyltransferase family protein [Eubacteriales bacterium]